MAHPFHRRQLKQDDIGRPRKGAHSQKDQAERGAPGSLQERYRAAALYSIYLLSLYLLRIYLSPSKYLPSKISNLVSSLRSRWGARRAVGRDTT